MKQKNNNEAIINSWKHKFVKEVNIIIILQRWLSSDKYIIIIMKLLNLGLNERETKRKRERGREYYNYIGKNRKDRGWVKSFTILES